MMIVFTTPFIYLINLIIVFLIQISHEQFTYKKGLSMKLSILIK